MIIRLKDWEIDLGEFFRRIRSDLRYTLAAMGTLLFLCLCGWLVLVPRPVPRAAVVVVGPEEITVRAGRETFSGPGPHRIPAGKISLRIEAAGYYPTGVELELSPNTTTTVTPTLYPRPEIREIAGLPGSRVEDVCLLRDAVRFRTAVTSTVSTASSPSGGFWTAPARTEEKVAMLWWSMTPDGRKERLFSLEAGGAASEDGRVAYVHPDGLYIEDRAVLTDTFGPAAAGWWGQEVMLFYTVPNGIRVELLSTETPTPSARFLTVLPRLPDVDCMIASPDGERLLAVVRGAADSFFLLDRAGRAEYLADVPASPLPWAYAAWQGKDVLWAAPGTNSWSIFGLDPSHRSKLLLEAETVHGLWVEAGELYFLDGERRVRNARSEVLYTMEEIEPADFALWRRGNLGILWNAGHFFLLSWPGGEDE